MEKDPNELRDLLWACTCALLIFILLYGIVSIAAVYANILGQL